jgi:hypothetical protein
MRQGRGGDEDRQRDAHPVERPSREKGRGAEDERGLHGIRQRMKEARVERPEVAEGVMRKRGRRDDGGSRRV